MKYLKVPLNLTNDTNGLSRKCLFYHFGGTIRSFTQAISHKDRICHFYQNVINAVNVNILDSSAFHVFEDVTIPQCSIKSAISIYNIGKQLKLNRIALNYTWTLPGALAIWDRDSMMILPSKVKQGNMPCSNTTRFSSFNPK